MNFIRKNQELAFFIGLFLVFIFIGMFSLSEPYHLDSVLYLYTSIDLQSDGELNFYFGRRPIISLTLIPFYFIFGKYGLLVCTLTLSYCSFILYYLIIKNISKNKFLGMASVFLVLSLDASLITISHLKEDFIAIFYVLLAFFVALKSSKIRFLSLFVFGLALMSKETVLFLIPLYLLLFWYQSNKELTVNNIFEKKHLISLFRDSLIYIVVIALILSLLNKNFFVELMNIGKSQYMGQFRFAMFDLGKSLWIKGIGVFLFFLQFLGFLVYFFEKDKRKKLLFLIILVNFLLLSFFLTNNTVMTYRNFIWPSFLSFVFIVYALNKLIPQKNAKFIWSIFLTVIFIFRIINNLPVMNYRSSSNLVEKFYTNFKTPSSKSILLGMDNCKLAEYYTRIKCKSHPVDAKKGSKEELDFFVELNQYLRDGYSVYLIPDFFAYDKYKVFSNKIQKEYKFLNTYTNKYESYHAMSLGVSYKKIFEHYKNKGCEVSLKDKTSSDIKGLDFYIFDLNCVGKSNSIKYYGSMYKIFPNIKEASIYRLNK
ncbi:MAG: Membrane protein [uncultured Campylobacterales bacterium]|uniref:Membrane protein n=1 Tax=uncultured Campylobacterales bacterium TaxID=352960 RepID=A0A6S6S3E9_9BACT|nr:MAG: Membrane protein [uncultured Campylobacterales bacterium]